jgi:L-malate glycosyltransferase
MPPTDQEPEAERPMGINRAGRRLRIVHLVPTLRGGGAENAVRALCRALPREDVDVRIVSIYPSGLGDAERAELGVDVSEIGRRGRRDVRFFPALVRELRRLRPDVVHAHLHTGQYAGRLAAALAGVPATVLTFHGDEPRGPVRGLADRVLHRRTARFVVFSEAQRRRVAAEERLPAERIAVIPNGLAPPHAARSRDDLRRQLGLPADAFVLYAVGRLGPEKNHRALVDAVRALHDQGAGDVHLVLAGEGSERAGLAARAAEHGLRSHVHLLGFRDDAAALAPAMDLFVLPSLRERMPLALGEAMLAGLPAVVTPWEGFDDLVGDGETAFVAGGFDGAALASAVLRAYGDAALRAAVAERARSVAAVRFDFGAMVRGHADLYRAVALERAR